MSHYHHLTRFEREKIMFFSAKGYSITAIAKELGRNKSTISRELRRNLTGYMYSPCGAQQWYDHRRKRCGPRKKLDDPQVWTYVRDRIFDDHWSPEQIAGRLKKENAPIRVSYATIYRGIYSGRFEPPKQRKRGQPIAAKKLRHHGKRRRGKNEQEKRGKIKISHELNERPKAAEERERIGDWEADTVMGKAGRACLVTLVDRKSRYLLTQKVERRAGDVVARAMIQLLDHVPVETITPDRGSEFARHAEVTEELNGAQFYFPPPYQPWQRGSNENTNGLLREYFPKGKDLTDAADKDIQMAADQMNLRPRKCLEYMTPFEVFYSAVLHLT